MQASYAFNERIISVFNEIKDGGYGNGEFRIPVVHNGEKVAELLPLTKKHLRDGPVNDGLVRLLAKWREENAAWYPSVFKVTAEGTKKWLKDSVIGAQDRLLFLVVASDGTPIGHMGFYRGEADNFLRGPKDVLKGAMTFSLEAMLDWAFSELRIPGLYLRVFGDNGRAIALYERCGFREIGRIPLRKVAEGDTVRWEEMAGDGDEAERHYSVMMIKNPLFGEDKHE